MLRVLGVLLLRLFGVSWGGDVEGEAARAATTHRSGHGGVWKAADGSSDRGKLTIRVVRNSQSEAVDVDEEVSRGRGVEE